MDSFRVFRIRITTDMMTVNVPETRRLAMQQHTADLFLRWDEKVFGHDKQGTLTEEPL